ncbi:GxxExxY protein [Lacibacter cauensis]|uniref:GxxExxY protein n=1 Tax=Lacibacter cauensis TaxID=510947 RepID=A0A562SDZ9_9BACT|nr:GxxExxY protein [Lacibacter cauensis]TWI79343.1 GxxExxY protein [Lacibacter cauensis]
MNTNEYSLNSISGAIVDCSIRVHRELGPGLLESVYEVCLMKELITEGLTVRRQVALPVYYKGENIGLDFKIDLLVEEEVVVELKAVDTLLPIHEAQLLTYLKLSEMHLGLLINFNVKLLKDGIKRMVW